MSAITRTVTTYFTASYDANDRDVESDIAITVSPDGLRHVIIETDLSDVPESEQDGVVERATDLYWAEEREAYEIASEGPY